MTYSHVICTVSQNGTLIVTVSSSSQYEQECLVQLDIVFDLKGAWSADCGVDTSMPLPMPNLTLPSGLSVPLPHVSIPYMSSAPGTIPVSLSVAPTMPAVNLSAVGVGGAVMPSQFDAAAAASQRTLCFLRLSLISGDSKCSFCCLPNLIVPLAKPRVGSWEL